MVPPVPPKRLVDRPGSSMPVMLKPEVSSTPSSRTPPPLVFENDDGVSRTVLGECPFPHVRLDVGGIRRGRAQCLDVLDDLGFPSRGFPRSWVGFPHSWGMP